MKKDEEICENKPKSRLELVLDFGRDLLKYLDRNPVEACILFAGIALGIAAWAIGQNAEDINSIISIFK